MCATTKLRFSGGKGSWLCDFSFLQFFGGRCASQVDFHFRSNLLAPCLHIFGRDQNGVIEMNSSKDAGGGRGKGGEGREGKGGFDGFPNLHVDAFSIFPVISKHILQVFIFPASHFTFTNLEMPFQCLCE